MEILAEEKVGDTYFQISDNTTESKETHHQETSWLSVVSNIVSNDSERFRPKNAAYVPYAY